MVGALGAEVDRLETEIRQIMPSIRHIDLASAPCSLFWHNLMHFHQLWSSWQYILFAYPRARAYRISWVKIVPVCSGD